MKGFGTEAFAAAAVFPSFYWEDDCNIQVAANSADILLNALVPNHIRPCADEWKVDRPTFLPGLSDSSNWFLDVNLDDGRIVCSSEAHSSTWYGDDLILAPDSCERLLSSHGFDIPLCSVVPRRHVVDTRSPAYSTDAETGESKQQ